MKPKILFSSIASLVLGCVSSVTAQTWNSTTTGGSWNLPGNWSGNAVPFVDEADVSLLFNVNGPTPGQTAYAVAYEAAQSATHLTVDVGNSGSNLVLNPGGGTLRLVSVNPGVVTPSITVNIGATSPHGGATALTINGGLTGTQGFSFRTDTARSPLIYMGGTNSITGGVRIDSSAMTINFHTPGALNGNALIYNQSASVLLGVRGTNNAYTWNSAVQMAAADARIVTFSHGAQTLTGVISGSANYDLNYSANSTTTGLMIVEGSNTYLGDTNINGMTLRATNDKALGGAGAATVTLTNATLQLSGGVSIEDKALTLSGAGHQAQGSLQNLDGDNRWDGGVVLGSTANPTINVTAGTLAIGGVVSGSTGLTKTGDGTLILENGANNYTGATTVSAGRLTIKGNVATGAGLTVQSGASLSGTGTIAQQVAISGRLEAGEGATGTLTITGGDVSLGADAIFSASLDSLALTNSHLDISGDLNFDLGGQTILTLQDLSPGEILAAGTQFRLATYGGSWNGGLLEYEGELLANHSLLSVGANQFEIVYDAQLGDSRHGLDLYVVQSIPEPGSMLLGIAGFMLMGYSLRRRLSPSKGDVFPLS